MTITILTDTDVGTHVTGGETARVLSGTVLDPADSFAVIVSGSGTSFLNAGTLLSNDFYATSVLAFGDGYRIVNEAGGLISGIAGIDASGSGAQIVNRGEITAPMERGTAPGAFAAIQAKGLSTSVIRNDGSLSGETGINVFFDCVDVRIDNAGTISGVYGIAIGGTDTQLQNAGTITATDTGIVIGNGSSGTEIYNSGLITSTGAGIAVYGTARIVNDGEIYGTSSIAAFINFPDVRLTVINTNLLSGQVYLTVSGDVLHNSGTIDGPVQTLDADDRVTNSGTITGDLDLGAGNDRYTGSGTGTATAVLGGAGADQMTGGDLGDVLDGGAGVDVLRGGAGDDVLRGGADRDVLTGDLGADVFEYVAVSDATVGTPDVITDFESGVDLIDLAALAPGALVFAGTAGFVGGGTGSVRYDVRGTGDAHLRVDVDGDGAADMRIVLKDTALLQSSDFGLG